MNSSTDQIAHSALHRSSHGSRHGYAPLWLAIPPALAVIGGIITLYLVARHPDQAIAVDPVTDIHDAQGTHQHVVNSVTPPLQ